MNQRNFIWLTVLLSVMFVLSFTPVLAQETEITSMSDEELLILLQQIMQRLEQGVSETAETPSAEPTTGPLAANTGGTLQEPRRFQIYKIKKLMVEGLPAYMFVQPEDERGDPKPNDPGKKKDDNNTNDGTCPPITPCMPGSEVYCTQHIRPDGVCVCMCG